LFGVLLLLLVLASRLRQNYYLGSGGSTPKALLFQEYLDMCQAENVEPTSNSAFGKLVRTYVPPTALHPPPSPNMAASDLAVLCPRSFFLLSVWTSPANYKAPNLVST
jgi:hypothetical protein